MAIQEMRRVLKPHGRICIADLMDHDSISLIDLVQIFENSGYITKHQKMNELLHVILAVPIR
jgi:putative AdoMet-dependent methyltransferase